MEIKVKESGDVNINVSQSNPSIVVKQSRDIDMTIAHPQIRVIPQRIHNIPFRFTQTVVEGANVIRCTAAEYPSYSPYDGKTWYAVVDANNHLQYLYLGADLVYPSQATNIGLEFAVVGSDILEFGDTAPTVTLAYSVTADGEAMVPNTLKLNGVSVSPRQASGTITTQCNNLGINTFILQATVGGKTVTSAVEVKTILPVFYGSYASGESLDDMVDNLHKAVIDVSKGFYEIEIENEGENVIVAVPNGFVLNDICTGGITIPCKEDSDSSLNIGGYDRLYQVYTSVNEVIPMTLKIELK